MSAARILTFRCAKTGGRFNAHFVARAEGRLYVVDRIGIVADATGNGSGTGGEPEPVVEYTTGQFSFHGWYCPHCGWAKGQVRTLFIRCGQCGEMVCGSRIDYNVTGPAIFVCYDACGYAGRVGGTITNYRATAAPACTALAISTPGRMAPRPDQLPARRN